MAITRVGTQEGGATVDSNTIASRAFGASVAVGNLIVVYACKDAVGSAFVAGDCTKTGGSAATLGAITLDHSLNFDLGGGSDFVRVGIWSAIVTGAGSLTMQVTGGSGTYWGISSGEYHSDAGGFDANRVEGINAGSSATDNATPGVTGDGTSAGAALFAAALVSNASSAVPIAQDGAFTLLHEEENGSLHLMSSQISRIVATGTTDQGEWTIDPGGRGFAAVLVVYKEVGGAPSGVPKTTKLTLLGVG